MRRLTAPSYAARRLGHRSTHSRISWQPKRQRVFARQPGQHQRGVRRHELEPRRRQARRESTSPLHPGPGRRRPLPAPAQATQPRPETSAASPDLAGRFGRTYFASGPPPAAMPAGGETQAVTLARASIASPEGGSLGDDRCNCGISMPGRGGWATRAEELNDTTRADLRDKEPHRTAGHHHRQAGDLGKGAASRRLTIDSEYPPPGGMKPPPGGRIVGLAGGDIWTDGPANRPGRRPLPATLRPRHGLPLTPAAPPARQHSGFAAS